MDVHLRYGLFHGAQNVPVMKWEIPGQSTLNANFCRTQLPGFDGFLGRSGQESMCLIREDLD